MCSEHVCATRMRKVKGQRDRFRCCRHTYNILSYVCALGPWFVVRDLRHARIYRTLTYYITATTYNNVAQDGKVVDGVGHPRRK